MGKVSVRTLVNCGALMAASSINAPRAAGDDRNCDGVDDDCDNATDEHFESGVSVCGLGACRREGTTSCANGELVDVCVAGTPAVGDPCDAIDNDCDGLVDEDHSPAW